MGAATVGQIVKETVKVLWEVLQPQHMPPPSTQAFLQISDDYMRLWNFPNCIGALDGKHIKIKSPKHSGTMYYNYKQFYSIVLQAVCNAHYVFTIIDVGGFGKQSDGGTFQSSNMYKLLKQQKLKIPTDSFLPETNIKAPFVFIADEAYPLMTHLLKPYSRRNLTPENMNFNMRLSRARKTIECAFGILYSKWRILSKAIETNEKTADHIIKAICILHNTIIHKEGFEKHLKLVTDRVLQNVVNRPRGRATNEAQFTRDTFQMYVNSFPIQYT